MGRLSREAKDTTCDLRGWKGSQLALAALHKGYPVAKQPMKERARARGFVGCGSLAPATFHFQSPLNDRLPLWSPRFALELGKLERH